MLKGSRGPSPPPCSTPCSGERARCCQGAWAMADSKELKPQPSSSSPNKGTLPIPSSHTALISLAPAALPFPPSTMAPFLPP